MNLAIFLEVPSAKFFLDGTVPATKFLLDGTVLSSKFLLDGTVPATNFYHKYMIKNVFENLAKIY